MTEEKIKSTMAEALAKETKRRVPKNEIVPEKLGNELRRVLNQIWLHGAKDRVTLESINSYVRVLMFVSILQTVAIICIGVAAILS